LGAVDDQEIPFRKKLIKSVFFSLSLSPDPKLVCEDDPENVKHEFAFDNPAFKGNFQGS
jgi:hypothetical protein